LLGAHLKPWLFVSARISAPGLPSKMSCSALGAFYRRLSARAGKSKAVTATARKTAVLFYNAIRHGMDYVDPGASYYETRYRKRVVKNLHRRAKAFGFILQAAEIPVAEQAVS
jgi:cytochrome c peroxidase